MHLAGWGLAHTQSQTHTSSSITREDQTGRRTGTYGEGVLPLSVSSQRRREGLRRHEGNRPASTRFGVMAASSRETRAGRLALLQDAYKGHKSRGGRAEEGRATRLGPRRDVDRGREFLP